jgi:hypothetical protein
MIKTWKKFIIQSTDTEREEVEVEKERIYVPVELLKVRSGRLGTDTLGIAHEIRRQKNPMGHPCIPYSVLTLVHPR